MFRPFSSLWLPSLLLLALVGTSCDRTSTEEKRQTQQQLPSAEDLRSRIDAVVQYSFSKRRLNTDVHAAWQVVHGALAYGPMFEIRSGDKLVPAIAYLLGGGTMTGWNLRKGDHGLEAILEEGSKTGQGHKDQWIGYLSQVGLTPETPIKVAGQQYTIADLIEQAKWDLRDPMEATWTLMAFGTYFPLDAEWQSRDGSTWTIDRVMEMEAGQPLEGAACGGSHRMYSLAITRNRARIENYDQGEAGEKADAKIRDAIAKAHEYQQPDGAFSAHMFDRPSSTAEISGLLHSTGHVLEFLTVALSDEQLAEPWVTRAVVKLLSILEAADAAELKLDCGGLYHAIHGLEIYRIRRWGLPEDAPFAKAAEPVALQASKAGGVQVARKAEQPPARSR
jgi:hypothetical protein